MTEVGSERTSTAVSVLVDTNILVYRFDSPLPASKNAPRKFWKRGIVEDSVRVPHQAIVKFITAVTRPIRGYSILPQADSLREAEELLKQFTVLYPNEAIPMRDAIRGCAAWFAAHQLSWFDAHPWAQAEHYGLSEILSEDLPHDRLHGTVRVVNPFIG
jgi:predicted nucleic acid-binding protein